MDTTNYYSYVYFYLTDYVKSFILINYDKKGKYIDDVTISSLYGDGGGFDYSEGEFDSDSVIIRVDEGGYNKSEENDIAPEFKINKIDENDSIIFTSRSKYKILLKKDGHIQIDTLR
jgi:hypothetical protein